MCDDDAGRRPGPCIAIFAFGYTTFVEDFRFDDNIAIVNNIRCAGTKGALCRLKEGESEV